MTKHDRPDPRATTATDRQIGARIRTRRKEANVSQQALGDTIGVSFQQIQKYEKGVNRVSASTLMDIAQALGVRTDTLLPESKTSGGKASMTEDADANAIVQALRRLNVEGRRRLLRLAHSLVADDKFQLRDRH